MDISEWQDAPRPRSATKATDPLFSPAVIGAIGALTLHGLIVQSVYPEFLHHRNRLSVIQSSGDTAVAAPGHGDDILLVEVKTPRRSAWITLDGASRFLVRSDLKRVIDTEVPPIPHVPLALNEADGVDASGSTAEITEKSRLSGIYSGQIQARIERVWRRPRTPITEKLDKARADEGESFQCEAQIVQDATGNVQEILLPRCNGTTAWQRSLVIAIQEASPLPAPPDASVFLSFITLNFVAFPYNHGKADDEYESPSIHSANDSR